MDGVLFFKSRFLVFSTRTCYDFSLFTLLWGTMGLPSPSVFRALVDIAIRFFDTQLSILIRFWYVIEVKRKKVVTVTSVPYLCFENFLNERYRHFCEKRETYI